MMGKLLLRGMLIGILAGIIAFGFARVFGEPPVAAAIALEEEGGGHSHEHGGTDDHAAMSMPADADSGGAPAAEEPEVEIVSRATQAGIGLLTGTTVYGMAMGGIFALVFAGVQGRWSEARPRVTVAWIAVLAYVALVIVPGLKYPPNPPAVGSPETIGLRTGLFFMMLVLSVVAMVVSVAIGRALTERHGGWNAALIGAVAFVIFAGIAMAAMPVNNEVAGSGFPADTLWDFRVASFGIRAVLFAVLGAGFGLLADRALIAPARPRYA